MKSRRNAKVPLGRVRKPSPQARARAHSAASRDETLKEALGECSVLGEMIPIYLHARVYLSRLLIKWDRTVRALLCILRV